MFPTSAIISRYFELSAFKNKEFYIYVHSLVDLDEKLTSRLHHTPSLCSLLGHVRPEDLQLGPGSRRSALRSDQQVLAPQRTYVWRPHRLRQEGHGMAMGWPWGGVHAGYTWWLLDEFHGGYGEFDGCCVVLEGWHQPWVMVCRWCSSWFMVNENVNEM